MNAPELKKIAAEPLVKATDLAKTFDVSPPWLNRVIELYRQAAKFGISALGDDDYIGWRPTMPPDFEIATAAGLICRVAATARAQSSYDPTFPFTTMTPRSRAVASAASVLPE